MNNENLIKKLLDSIAAGDDEADAAAIAKEALEAGVPAMDLVEQAVQPAMKIIGDRYDCGDAFLPELMLAGDAGIAVLDVLIPHLSAKDLEGAQTGTVILGTLAGDNHDIGKNLVGAMLSANGFKVVDIGIDVQAGDFLRAAAKEEAQIIAASTLLTTSLPYQRDIARLLVDSGNREKYFYIVGGGPTTGEWAKEIKADGYGFDANDAVKLCQQLMDMVVKAPLPEPIIQDAR
jgi:methanogenic corrinoid protein MtbC1